MQKIRETNHSADQQFLQKNILFSQHRHEESPHHTSLLATIYYLTINSIIIYSTNSTHYPSRSHLLISEVLQIRIFLYTYFGE